MDIIFISELTVETVIGVYGWEREVRRPLVLDIELAGDCATAAASDDVDATVDYSAICTRVSDFARESEFHLVETLAERVAELIREEFKVPWVRLRVSKPAAVASARSVGVVIERGTRA